MIVQGYSLIYGGPDEAEILKSRMKLFQHHFRKDENEARQKSEQLYYVSTYYVEQFNAFCSHREKSLKPLNFDIAQSSIQKTVKKYLEKDRDYFLVSKQVLQILSLNPKFDIILPYEQKIESKELNPEIEFVDYIQLTKWTVLEMTRISNPSHFLKKKSLKVNPSSSLKDLIEQIQKQLQLKNRKIRLWKCSPDDIKDQNIVRKYANLSRVPKEIPAIGELIESDLNPHKTQRLQDIGMNSDHFFIAEIVHNRDDWFLTKEKKCPTCHKEPNQCHCRSSRSCIHPRQRSGSPPITINKCAPRNQITFQTYSRKGLVGLENIGNTCYMNSCLQCLSHTEPLTEYFLKGYYKKQINTSNMLGTKGQLPRAYADFIKNMWYQSQNTYAPRQLKRVLSGMNPMYQGSLQHDSHQFLTFLVDLLNEDFNRITMKPKKRSIESNGRPDAIVAEQSWARHTSKKQSVVTDFMTGQLKQQFTCSKCHSQSVKFESFTTIALPIEQEQPGQIDYYLIYSDLSKLADKLTYRYNRVDPGLWVKDMTKALDTRLSAFALYILSYDDFYNVEECSKEFLVEKMRRKHEFYLFEKKRAGREKASKSIELFVNFKILKNSSWKKTYESENGFKRPMMFQKEKLQGKLIKEAIFRQIQPLYRKNKYQYKTNSDIFASALVQSGESAYMHKMEMLQKCPFQINLKFMTVQSPKQSRKVQYLDKINDGDDLLNLIGKGPINECQLEVIFNGTSLQLFEFKPLLHFYDKTEQPLKNRYKSEPQISLEQCLTNFTEKQTLRGQNQLRCDHCQKDRPTTKQMSIYKAPQILVLQLKRFKSVRGYQQKNNTDVLFSHELDMTKHVIDQQPMSSYNQLLKSQPHYHQPPYEISGTDSKLIYELYAVINHSGTLDSGHYTAMAKNKESWYKFNDRYYHKIHEAEVFSQQAYVLFYQRKNKAKLI